MSKSARKAEKQLKAEARRQKQAVLSQKFVRCDEKVAQLADQLGVSKAEVRRHKRNRFKSLALDA